LTVNSKVKMPRRPFVMAGVFASYIVLSEMTTASQANSSRACLT